MKTSIYSVRSVIVVALICTVFSVRAQNITTIAGGLGNGSPAVAIAQMHDPVALCADISGNIYVADQHNHCVRRVAPNGFTTVIAGVGYAGYSGDGGSSLTAKLSSPSDVCVDLSGNVYIADKGNNVIRKVTPFNTISTIAGTGVAGFLGDGFAATAAQLNAPTSVKIDPTGNLYISDAGNKRIRKINTSGNITTICGIGTAGFSGDGNPATTAEISSVTYLTPDASGYLYFSDQNRIRRIDPAGIVNTIAGGPVAGSGGDGGAATLAQLNSPKRLGIDILGNLYVADSGNFVVRKITAGGFITTFAGNHAAAYAGDGALATAAGMVDVQGVCADQSGNIFIADGTNNRVRKVGTGDTINTYAGQGNYGGDGGSATDCTLYGPIGATPDGAGNVYIADCYNHVVRKIDASGGITTIAGTGVAGYSGDSGPATAAQLDSPMAVAITNAGEILISDMGNHAIRLIDPSGMIITYAGSGLPGYTGDLGLAVGAKLNRPNGIKVDIHNNLYIADCNNSAIRKVDGLGFITTVVGNGSGIAGYSGDGGLASGASINRPSGVAWDTHDNLYISDMGNNRIRKVDISGMITTIVGGSAGYSGDGGLASGASINHPAGVAVDTFGNMFIADDGNNVVRRIDQAGIITSVAGNGNVPYNGDGGPATAAALSAWRVSLDNSGHMYIADGVNNRIRKVSYTPVSGISTINPNNAEIDVFPNPANDLLTIRIPGNWQDVTLTVIDLMGKVVSKSYVQNTSSDITINTRKLPVGTYILKMDIGAGVYRNKIVVTR